MNPPKVRLSLLDWRSGDGHRCGRSRYPFRVTSLSSLLRAWLPGGTRPGGGGESGELAGCEAPQGGLLEVGFVSKSPLCARVADVSPDLRPVGGMQSCEVVRGVTGIDVWYRRKRIL